MKLGQYFVNYSGFLGGDGVSRKNAFEIYWPLGNMGQILKLLVFGRLSSGESKGVEGWFVN